MHSDVEGLLPEEYEVTRSSVCRASIRVITRDNQGENFF